MNRTAYRGSSATATAGWCAIDTTPSSAMTMNQTIMTGPNARPIFSVPKRCPPNKTRRMTTAIGMTKGLNVSVTTLTPSSALSTEMAGVMTPSP